MSRIVHLQNGSAIKADVIEAFDRAVEQPENIEKGTGSTDFWNNVEADMFFDLKVWYSSDYIIECFEALADEFELDTAWDRLQVLKTDYLGLEA